MKEYLMQWESRIGDLAWEYHTHHASDEMAYDYSMLYAKRLLKDYDGATAILLWAMPEQTLLARFILRNHPEIEDTHNELFYDY